ncbi:hypothetical protein AGMMS49942_00820 [Spirochaetia bacterium]|nr:hypothetical protein AGMMS49942_00820 [Spirochaetia bacterium]
MSDPVPRKDEKFNPWVRNVCIKAETAAPALNIPIEVFTPIDAKLGIWSAAWTAFLAPNHGAMDRQAKNDARAALEPAVRDLIRQYLINNPALTNRMKIDMGLPIHDTTRTKPANPSTTVDVWKIDSSIIRRLGIWYKNSEGKSRAKPLHYHGVRVNGAILDHYPQGLYELTDSFFNTASPFIKRFTEAERGKTFYFVLRWENDSAGNDEGVGDWSEIHSAVVP